MGMIKKESMSREESCNSLGGERRGGEKEGGGGGNG